MLPIIENTQPRAYDRTAIFHYLDTLIGNTKLHRLNYDHGNLYTKLEFQNIFGSIKDRPALYILRKAYERHLIDDDTTVIESTSGNFGIALAGICRLLKIKFVPVIDPNISGEKANILKLNGCEPVRVSERDETGGFLLNRRKVVKEYLEEHQNAFTPNQYENPDNYMAYYYTLGNEICNVIHDLDYAFISVSTGGTITGLSQRLKEHYKNIRIIAVDVQGSMIFSNKPAIRKLSGMGASLRTPLFDNAQIDDFVILSQADIIKGCESLYSRHSLFLGASSGAAYAASDLVLKRLNKKNINAIFISPDGGNSYIDTVYNSKWVTENIIT